MDRQDRNWETLKRRYLRDVRRALSAVKGACVQAVLGDVSAHLDQRLAESACLPASPLRESSCLRRCRTTKLAEATGDDFDKMTRAIAALGNVAAQEAVDVLIAIGDKPKRGNRPRWMAVRALGRIADRRAVPLLIGLLDHCNTDTRLYARIALCEITGVYFGDSREKWSTWARQQGIELRPSDGDRDIRETGLAVEGGQDVNNVTIVVRTAGGG